MVAQQKFEIVGRMGHTCLRLEALARQGVIINQNNQIGALGQGPIPGENGGVTDILVIDEQVGRRSCVARWHLIGTVQKRDSVACPLDGRPKMAYLRACGGNNNGYWLNRHNTDILPRPWAMCSLTVLNETSSYSTG
jgi:hypothetical protein